MYLIFTKLWSTYSLLLVFLVTLCRVYYIFTHNFCVSAVIDVDTKIPLSDVFYRFHKQPIKYSAIYLEISEIIVTSGVHVNKEKLYEDFVVSVTKSAPAPFARRIRCDIVFISKWWSFFGDSLLWWYQKRVLREKRNAKVDDVTFVVNLL